MSTTAKSALSWDSHCQDSDVVVIFGSLSRIWLCDPMDYSPPGSSVHGISQAKILEWIAISLSRGSYWTRNLTCISCTGRHWFIPLSHQRSPRAQMPSSKCDKHTWCFPSRLMMGFHWDLSELPPWGQSRSLTPERVVLDTGGPHLIYEKKPLFIFQSFKAFMWRTSKEAVTVKARRRASSGGKGTKFSPLTVWKTWQAWGREYDERSWSSRQLSEAPY